VPLLPKLAGKHWGAIGAVAGVGVLAVGVLALSRGGGGGGSSSSAGPSSGDLLGAVKAGSAAAASGSQAGAQLGAAGLQAGAQLGGGALQLAGRVVDVLGRSADLSVSQLARVSDAQTRGMFDVFRSLSSSRVSYSGPVAGGGAAPIMEAPRPIALPYLTAAAPSSPTYLGRTAGSLADASLAGYTRTAPDVVDVGGGGGVNPANTVFGFVDAKGTLYSTPGPGRTAIFK
jgi:hypothetical protein